MSGTDLRNEFPTLHEFGDQLTRSARARQRGMRIRRRLGAVAALVIAVPVGLAVAGELSEEPTVRVIEPGETLTIGFLDPETEEPLLCPNGEPFTWTIPADRSQISDPTCPDGSVPELYEASKAEEEAYLEQLQPGEPITDLPSLPTYVVPEPDE